MSGTRLLLLSIPITVALTMVHCSQDCPKVNYVQTVPEMTPVPFTPDGFAHAERLHGRLSFSPDGSSALWSSFFGDGSANRVYQTDYENGRWTKPILANLNQVGYTAGPIFSDSGRTLLFCANRKAPLWGEATPTGIWTVTREGRTWGKPEAITVTLDTAWFIGNPTIAANGNLYISLRKYAESIPGIWVSYFQNGNYLPPVKMTAEFGDVVPFDPFIDPMERYLIVGGFGPDGHGMSDLYILTRNDDNSWSDPINLGQPINSEAFERFPSVSPDGDYLFFVRGEGTNFNGASTQFYWVEIEALESAIE